MVPAAFFVSVDVRLAVLVRRRWWCHLHVTSRCLMVCRTRRSRTMMLLVHLLLLLLLHVGIGYREWNCNAAL